jgi:hypothetical protein
MICTFHSTERGVGRSMAVANVAELLRQQGHRVIVADWNLESPGLDRLFSLTAPDSPARQGVIDLFLEYKAEMSRPIGVGDDDTELPTDRLERYLTPIAGSSLSSGGQLFLLSAGMRDSHYAERVGTFDWSEFAREWEGDLFVEQLRQKFMDFANVVLIDSAVGTTEVSRVCTSMLADVVVMFCALGTKSLEATASIVKELADPRVLEKRAGRQIAVLVVPARVEYHESALLNEFMHQFLRLFAPYVPLPLERDLNVFWELQIPNISYYEYREGQLVVNHPEQVPAKPLVGAYRRLVEAIERLGPSGRGSAKQLPAPPTMVPAGNLAAFKTLRVRKTETPRVFVSYAREDEETVRTLSRRLTDVGFKTWIDKDNLHAGEDWQKVIENTIEGSDFVIICLSSRAVVKKGFVQREIRKTLEVVQMQPEDAVYLIPVRLDACQLPRSMAHLHAVDLFESEGFARLEESIRYAWRQSRAKRS